MIPRRVTDDFDEMDPIHGKLDEALNSYQFAALAALEQAVRDNEFTSELENDRDNPDRDNIDLDIGTSDDMRTDAVARSRRAASRLEKLVRRSAKLASRGDEVRKHVAFTTPQDAAALRSGILDVTTVTHASPVRQPPSVSDFTSMGYTTTIAKYKEARRQFIMLDRSFDKSKTKKVGKTQRVEHRVRKETETVEGDTMYLAVDASPKESSLSCAIVDDDVYYAIVDTGTTVSIATIKRRDMFETFNKKRTVTIAGFNNSKSKSSGSGTIAGFVRDVKGKRIPLRLPRVHEVPGAPHDLISVSNMKHHGFSFIFTPDESYMLTPDKEKVPMIEKGGLFWMRIKKAIGPAAQEVGQIQTANTVWHDEHELLNEVSTPNSGAADEPRAANARCVAWRCENCSMIRRAGVTNVPLDVMHRRLNHCNIDTIKRMAKNGALDVNVMGKTSPVCGVCETAKAHRRAVPKHREYEPEELKPFQRVWCDLKGKLDKDFWGNQYICTWTCEATRWSYVSFIAKKSDAKAEYKKFLEWVELNGFKVGNLNSDSGGEYTSSNGKLTVNHNAKVITEFEKISKAHKVQQNFTAPYTPEHNGVSERLNRTLVESGRALLIEAGIAKEFWSLAVKHLVYVKNRMYHSALTQGNCGASPYQSVFGKAPRFKQLRVFGCDAWKLDHHHRSGSWKRKAKKMIFVGISENKKGWVLLDPSTRKLTTTYHATFDEDMSNRRCALRDFDLRQAKAGAGASHDEARQAKLERCLYDDNAPLVDREVYKDFETSSIDENDDDDDDDEPPPPRQQRKRTGHHEQRAHGRAEEKESEEVDDDDDEPSPQRQQRKRTGHHNRGDPATPEFRGDRPSTRSSTTSSARSSTPPTSPASPTPRRPDVPTRRAAIGAPQGLDDDDYKFIRQAYENDLPLVFTQRNPKRHEKRSRTRYEKYKSALNLREAITRGATWDDIKWDFDRGWVDFTPTARSNHATIIDLMERQRMRTMNDNSSNLNYLTFEESIQQEYGLMASEVIEELSHREQRLLEQALEGQTLTEFAYSCAARIMIDEPLTVREAMASENASEWRAAMTKEIDMLTKFKCFGIVTQREALQHGKLVKSKWVFKVKYQQDGEVERFKARLVAKGFSQRPGQDYVDGETYSPVFSYSSLRTIVSKAANDDFQLDCWDLASSFVQQPLDVDHMYMVTPDGYPKTTTSGERTALHVRQSLYGLKQASRLLSDRLSSYLKSIGFKQLISDRCVFVKGHGREQLIAATWVDDIVLSSAKENKAGRRDFDKALRREFEMSPWTSGETDWLLNIKVTRDWDKGTIHLSQPQAIEKLAMKFNLTGREGRNPSIPMSPTLKLEKPAEKDIVPSSEFDYPSAVGGMLYLSLTARPDVAQSVGVLSRFMACPSQEHVKAAKQVIQYLYATKDMGITYTRGGSGSPHMDYEQEDGLQTYVHTRKSKTAIDDPMGDSFLMGSYADADLAGDIGTRKSTTGFCMVLNGGVINWSSKLQATVALSTAEAETIAGTETVKQVMHLRLFLRELGQEQREPSIVYEDNAAAIALGHGNEQSKRSKHYAIKVAFLNEKYKEGVFAYKKVSTKFEIADAFTKALPRDDFCRFRQWMGVT